MKTTISFFYLLIVATCAGHLSAQNNLIFGLATPIELHTETTRIFLEDYFNDANSVSEIIAPDYLRIQRDADNTFLITPLTTDFPHWKN